MIQSNALKLGFVLWLLSVAGCHRADLPPIEGRYVTPDGQDTLLKDGRFFGAMVGQGSYVVDGSHLTLRLTQGPRLEGERLDENHFQITQRDGQTIRPADFYREGSPGADAGRQALATRLGHPIPTDAEREAQAAAQRAGEAAAAFTPDPSTPLDTAEAAAIVAAAFAAPPLTDEQLLTALVPGYAQQADSFKRHDMAAGLPELKAKIEQTRTQHYYSIPVSTDAHERGPFASESLESFDLATHSFPLVSGSNMCFRQLANGMFRVDVPRFGCRFPVTDEALARKLEAARATNLILPVGGRVYFAVTGAAPFHQGVPAVPLHAQLKVVDPKDPSVHAEASL